jgi:hypothetical protein
LKFRNKKWDWLEVSANPGIKFRDILANPTLQWDWHGVGQNRNVTAEMIMKNLELPWDWIALSQNPNLTAALLIAHPTMLNWRDVSRNRFKYDFELEEMHLRNLSRIRARIRLIKIPKCYKLYLLTKTNEFMSWYCAPGNIGNLVDKHRILATKLVK